jgi:hypothetical protein
MEWIIRRMFAGGRRIKSQHLVQAGLVRGVLAIREEFDADRGRHFRVARVHGGPDVPQIPPLIDVQITASTSGGWSLSGFERVETGALSDEHLFGQAWMLEPASDQDLIKAETEINRMAALLAQHGLDPKAHPQG